MLWLLLVLALAAIAIAYGVGHWHARRPAPLPPEIVRDISPVECVLMDAFEREVISRRVLPAHKRPDTFIRYHGRRIDRYEYVRREGNRHVYRLKRETDG